MSNEPGVAPSFHVTSASPALLVTTSMVWLGPASGIVVPEAALKRTTAPGSGSPFALRTLTRTGVGSGELMSACCPDPDSSVNVDASVSVSSSTIVVLTPGDPPPGPETKWRAVHNRRPSEDAAINSAGFASVEVVMTG